MIVDAILSALLAPSLWLLELLPAINFQIPDDAFANIDSFFGGLGYFVPMAAITPILLAMFAFKAAKVIMALIVRIKSFIPTMGA